ncbi:hypothetical protein ACFV6F_26705, partial [Kitasatospora phosalacinea]|uniref:hypothetical protein n=1 Tax=Kitasatospora phosalacinea TaxID=2065 RepID=UPI00365893C8
GGATAGRAGVFCGGLWWGPGPGGGGGRRPPPPRPSPRSPHDPDPDRAAPAAAARAADNGDVKIHDTTTSADNHDDEPKVCKFYVDGFNFDAGQSITWHIDQQPPTGNAQVLSGALLMPTGHARSGDLSLPDGHYKLFWNFTGENGNAKQKVFMVDCSGVGSSPSPSPSPSGSPSPVGNDGSSSPSPSSGTSPSPGASPSGKGGAGGGPSASPGGPGQGGPGQGGPGRTPQGGVAAGAGGSSRDLNPAEVTVGAALIAGAGYLVVRRRRRSRR